MMAIHVEANAIDEMSFEHIQGFVNFLIALFHRLSCSRFILELLLKHGTGGKRAIVHARRHIVC